MTAAADQSTRYFYDGRGQQLGVLNALTASEKAKGLAPGGQQFKEEVEPLTNYFVGRLKKNYRNGDYTFGAIGTSVLRRFDNPALEQLLPGHAEAVGFDWNMGWKKRTYSFMGNFALSDVSGDSMVIGRLQRSSARYFQRPDRGAGSNGAFTSGYDGTLTGMRGYGGYARLAKDAGDWMGEAQVNYRSPGFEVNDLAFLTRADYFWVNGNIIRAFTKPTRNYRRMDYIVGGQQQVNYDGDVTDRQVHTWLGTETPFYWTFTGSLQYRAEAYDDRLTRGGPVVRKAAQRSAFFSIQSDSRKRVVVGLNPFFGSSSEGGSNFSLSGDVNFKPATNLSVSLSPSYSRDVGTAQFVRKFADPAATNFFGQRVVFSSITQKTLAFDTRVSATFTPTLTLEVVLQPFVSSGDYYDFKEFRAPRQLDKHVFGGADVTVMKDATGTDSLYVLDPDHNAGTENFSWRNPDFNFRSLRGNAVLRWEYRPGSTMYVVWQQQRAGSAGYGDFDVSRDIDAIFRQHADNIFLVKVSYWLPR